MKIAAMSCATTEEKDADDELEVFWKARARPLRSNRGSPEAMDRIVVVLWTRLSNVITE